ncbi:MAG: YgaP family membrane protein [Leptospirales bacterium]
MNMRIERIVRGFAGMMVLISLLLAHYLSTEWLWLTAFVGLNLFQSSLTRWCLLDQILRRVLGNGPEESGSCKTV